MNQILEEETRMRRNPCNCDLDINLASHVQQVLFPKRSEELDRYFSSTLFFACIDPRSLPMSYVNAGHPAPLVLRDFGTDDSPADDCTAIVIDFPGPAGG